MKKKNKTNVELNPHFDKTADLIRKSKDLVAIVEGVHSKRWASGSLRLKDTPEWAAFYVIAQRVSNIKP